MYKRFSIILTTDFSHQKPWISENKDSRETINIIQKIMKEARELKLYTSKYLLNRSSSRGKEEQEKDRLIENK